MRRHLVGNHQLVDIVIGAVTTQEWQDGGPTDLRSQITKKPNNYDRTMRIAPTYLDDSLLTSWTEFYVLDVSKG